MRQATVLLFKLEKSLLEDTTNWIRELPRLPLVDLVLVGCLLEADLSKNTLSLGSRTNHPLRLRNFQPVGSIGCRARVEPSQRMLFLEVKMVGNPFMSLVHNMNRTCCQGSWFRHMVLSTSLGAAGSTGRNLTR